MNIEVFQVDAFTDRAFAGNPAAVCILPAPQDDRWLQDVAGEMNLSETAFLVRVADGFDLRWFTPCAEVDLCGHATLASAHVLWETGLLRRGEQARFHTRSGLLTAVYGDGWIEMNFPAQPPQAVEAPAALTEALGAVPVYIGRNVADYLVEFESEAVLRQLRPDFVLLKKVPTRGIIVTSRSDSGDYDFISRFFAPALGVDEDPVTGSAHCCLGPYWGEKLNRSELIAYQASRRGGLIRLRLGGDRVYLAGQAVTVWRGELLGK
ncbi:MAG: PhzF family phenazine biosynthesis protein [Thermacetogeniaceae bacterium]